MKNSGILVVSLDFELFWGVRDKMSLHQYKENLLGVRLAIPAMLEVFYEHNIHVTWATVGFLFCESKQQLLNSIPLIAPTYEDRNLSPYLHLEWVGNNETEDSYHFAHSLIQLILSYPNQRIATHTFSHYYCLESGQNIDSFRADLLAARNIAQEYDIKLESLVFPRNQINPEYLSVCEEIGIKTYRGNEKFWMYKASPHHKETFWKRGTRFLDSYLDLTGHNCHLLKEIQSTFPRNIPSSRFLRPYTKKIKILEPLKVRRICSDLTYAAFHGLLYHLWWHPHNFGIDLDQNLRNLRQILEHFQLLQKRYGIRSLNMEEVTELTMEIPMERNLA